MGSQLIYELREQRISLGLSQRALASELGCSQSEYSRLERTSQPGNVSFVRVAEVASLLGLTLSASLHPEGEPIRDKGHQALISRFRALLSASFKVRAEVPLPGPGDPRVWDLVLTLGHVLFGVEAETRIRDMQRLVRRIHQRERHGGVDEIIVLLSDSQVNRRLAPDLRMALGERFATTPRQLLRVLRSGTLPPGSGVLLM
ncbi:MAG: helix-turn-helix transcriptional regulator [Chloroflexota bacterium]|nr:helix-turn-helix transcriptional regulator [Chloroflexota bacterium]